MITIRKGCSAPILPNILQAEVDFTSTPEHYFYCRVY